MHGHVGPADVQRGRVLVAVLRPELSDGAGDAPFVEGARNAQHPSLPASLRPPNGLVCDGHSALPRAGVDGTLAEIPGGRIQLQPQCCGAARPAPWARLNLSTSPR